MAMVVSLPYPDPRDPALAAVMGHLDAQRAGAGRAHYVGLCMRGVNQSIGRAIRHKDDFAAVVLVDERFAEAAVAQMLPAWMHKEAPVADEDVVGKLTHFFSKMTTGPKSVSH
eukprot:gnl/Ergobibamus_cyprinoides/951.p4 GENE.gnl/Ergobibamus_cyprinoides/951~~gnl/Ergobibamus_cyprinoides/951.p4  ORF type:complete len:113 (-),score=12.68 gnl/Ergobibamus_cyprinoides/951:204-542(-)